MKRLFDIRAAAVIAAVAGIFVLAGALAGPFARSALAADAAPPEAAVCAGCHGTHGEGGANIPRLAGQNADYLSHALAMFKEGTRASDIMQPIARTLDEAQMRQLADYFSKQAAPLADGASASPELVLAGKQLAETGGPNVSACFTCHGAQGKGNGAHFPSIAGQPAQYVVERLRQFQQRAGREAPAPGTMTAVAATMNEQQIEQAAAYLAQLAP